MQHGNRFGLIGEADFRTNCLLHDLKVADPCGAYDAFDTLVGKLRPFWRAQIKTTANLSRHKAYHVGVARRTRIRGIRGTAVYSPDEVDFICIYLVPEDTWYIVPIEVVDGRLALTIHAHDHPKIGPWVPYREAWHLLAQTGDRIILPDPELNALTPRRRKFNGRTRKLK